MEYIFSKQIPANSITLENGVVVNKQVPGVFLKKCLNSNQLDNYRKLFLEEEKSFPEYKDSGAPKVLGGFAAYGNPSSFHNPTARQLRTQLYDTMKNHINLPKGFKFEMLMDRYMYRFKDTAPSAESWHRDVAKPSFIHNDDELFGGWINLDTQPQYFSCIPGSHLGIKLKDIKSGFAVIPKDQIKIVKPHQTQIEIPPGYIVYFPQYILHEVVSKKATRNMMRLFCGWRFTRANTSFLPNMKQILMDQGCPLLPSGQSVPMYSANHQSCFLEKSFLIKPSTGYKDTLIGWSEKTFHPDLLISRKHSAKGYTYKVIPRFMKSLKELGLTMYPAYTSQEINMFKPMNQTNNKPLTPNKPLPNKPLPKKPLEPNKPKKSLPKKQCKVYKKTKDPKCDTVPGCMWVTRKGCVEKDNSNNLPHKVPQNNLNNSNNVPLAKLLPQKAHKVLQNNSNNLPLAKLLPKKCKVYKKTKVINISVKHLRPMGYENLEEWLKNDNHVYIGRNMEFYVKGAKKSKWANPYSVKKYGREKALDEYRKKILNTPELLNDLEELNGKTLGCWCAPEKCHGDILVELLKKQCKS